MRIDINKDRGLFYRIARRKGGLFLGFRIHFPVSVWDGMDEPEIDHKATNTMYQSIWVNIGLLIWEVGFHIDYNIKPINERQS